MAFRSEVDEKFVVDGSVDYDSVMRETLHHESAEVLRHQLICERSQSAKLQRTDVFLSFLLAGIGVGLGFRAVTPSVKSRRSK